MPSNELTANEIQWLRDCKAAGFDPVLEIQKLRDQVMFTQQDLDKWIRIATERAIRYGDLAWAAHQHLEWLDNQERSAALEAAWQTWYAVHHVEVAHLLEASKAERDQTRSLLNNDAT